MCPGPRRGLWALDAIVGEPELLGAAGLDAGGGGGPAAAAVLEAALIGLRGGPGRRGAGPGPRAKDVCWLMFIG